MADSEGLQGSQIYERLASECPRGLYGVTHRTMACHMRRTKHGRTYCIVVDPMPPLEILEAFAYLSPAQEALFRRMHFERIP